MSAKIGCSGWSYNDGVGSFYAKETRPQDFLTFYSRIFGCVEIDSTFYRVPSATMVEKWYDCTPSGFIFAPKLPKQITDDKRLQDVQIDLQFFFRRPSFLREKLGPVVVQLPPSFRHPKHHRALVEFVEDLPTQYRYAIEFRHESWFNDEIKAFLERNKICQAWSVSQSIPDDPCDSKHRFRLPSFCRRPGNQRIQQITRGPITGNDTVE